MINQLNNKRKVHVYLLEEALKHEDSIARQLDDSGYAGMIKSDGTANRSSLVSALYLIAAGKKNQVPRKDAKNREE